MRVIGAAARLVGDVLMRLQKIRSSIDGQTQAPARLVQLTALEIDGGRVVLRLRATGVDPGGAQRSRQRLVLLTLSVQHAAIVALGPVLAGVQNPRMCAVKAAVIHAGRLRPSRQAAGMPGKLPCRSGQTKVGSRPVPEADRRLTGGRNGANSSYDFQALRLVCPRCVMRCGIPANTIRASRSMGSG